MVPGSSSASWPALRPFSGSDCTVLPEITSPTTVDSVCRIGEAATTSTVSCTAPTAMRKSSRATCRASSVTALRVTVRKPDSSAFTR